MFFTIKFDHAFTYASFRICDKQHFNTALSVLQNQCLVSWWHGGERSQSIKRVEYWSSSPEVSQVQSGNGRCGIVISFPWNPVWAGCCIVLADYGGCGTVLHVWLANQEHVGVWIKSTEFWVIVRRAGLLWSQQDFEWRWSVPLFKCLTVLEFSFILFDLCLLITFFNFIMNYVPIVTFWIFTYHKIWILSIMFCFIWSYWIIYFLACLEVSWRVVS